MLDGIIRRVEITKVKQLLQQLTPMHQPRRVWEFSGEFMPDRRACVKASVRPTMRQSHHLFNLIRRPKCSDSLPCVY
jgi:hypothetical protein